MRTEHPELEPRPDHLLQLQRFEREKKMLDWISLSIFVEGWQISCYMSF
jgi:hypothetical protein